MKIHISPTAIDFKLSLEAGIIEREEIVCWADRLLETEEHDDTIAEISLSSNKTNKDIEALLAHIAGSGSECEWGGMRRMLGRMHGALASEPGRLHAFTRFLEQLWIRNDYTIPQDLNFIIGLEDAYLLAEEGQYGSVDEIYFQLLQDLSRFR